MLITNFSPTKLSPQKEKLQPSSSLSQAAIKTPSLKQDEVSFTSTKDSQQSTAKSLLQKAFALAMTTLVAAGCSNGPSTGSVFQREMDLARETRKELLSQNGNSGNIVEKGGEVNLNNLLALTAKLYEDQQLNDPKLDTPITMAEVPITGKELNPEQFMRLAQDACVRELYHLDVKDPDQTGIFANEEGGLRNQTRVLPTITNTEIVTPASTRTDSWGTDRPELQQGQQLNGNLGVFQKDAITVQCSPKLVALDDDGQVIAAPDSNVKDVETQAVNFLNELGRHYQTVFNSAPRDAQGVPDFYGTLPTPDPANTKTAEEIISNIMVDRGDGVMVSLNDMQLANPVQANLQTLAETYRQRAEQARPGSREFHLNRNMYNHLREEIEQKEYGLNEQVREYRNYQNSWRMDRNDQLLFKELQENTYLKEYANSGVVLSNVIGQQHVSAITPALLEMAKEQGFVPVGQINIEHLPTQTIGEAYREAVYKAHLGDWGYDTHNRNQPLSTFTNLSPYYANDLVTPVVNPEATNSTMVIPYKVVESESAGHGEDPEFELSWIVLKQPKAAVQDLFSTDMNGNRLGDAEATYQANNIMMGYYANFLSEVNTLFAEPPHTGQNYW